MKIAFANFLILSLLALMGCNRDVGEYPLSQDGIAVSHVVSLLDHSITNNLGLVAVGTQIRGGIKSVTNANERAVLFRKYLNQIANLDLIGPEGKAGPLQVHVRCLAIRDAMLDMHETVRAFGCGELGCLELDLKMVKHIDFEIVRLLKVVNRLPQSKMVPFQHETWGYVDYRKCVDFMVDVRRYWVMQHLDAPKCMYDFCFKE